MSVTSVFDKLVSHIKSCIKILGFVERKDGGKLFMGKRFGDVYRGYFPDQYLCIFFHSHTSHLGDHRGRLANDFGIYGSCVCQYDLPYFIQFFAAQYMAASFYKFLFHIIIDVGNGSHRLFRCTDHAIVKGFGMDDRVNRSRDIAGAVHDDRGVARSDADGRFSGGIGGFYHSGTACCQDHVHGSHQLIGKLNGGFLHPADDSLRCPCFHCSFQDDSGCFNGGSFCTGMRAYYDCISGLQADQTFEDSSGRGVRSRDDGSHNSHRLCDLFYAE